VTTDWRESKTIHPLCARRKITFPQEIPCSFRFYRRRFFPWHDVRRSGSFAARATAGATATAGKQPPADGGLVKVNCFGRGGPSPWSLLPATISLGRGRPCPLVEPALNAGGIAQGRLDLTFDCHNMNL